MIVKWFLKIAYSFLVNKNDKNNNNKCDSCYINLDIKY